MSDEPPKVGDRGSSADQPIRLSKAGTIIIRVKAAHRSAAFRWVRGVLIAGIAAGVVALVRYLGGF